MENLVQNFDPAADLLGNTNPESAPVTVHVTQRKARKYTTTVSDLTCHIGTDNVSSFLKRVKKECSCNGCFKAQDDVFQFQGDQREGVVKILEGYGIIPEQIVLRGA